MAGGWYVDSRVSSDATACRTRTRPEDTGAGSYTKCGANSTDIPGRLVMGLHDASSGACRDFCLCGLYLFFAQNCSNRTVLSSSYLMCDGAHPAHIRTTVCSGHQPRWPVTIRSFIHGA